MPGEVGGVADMQVCFGVKLIHVTTSGESILHIAPLTLSDGYGEL